MRSPPIPTDEVERLEALEGYEILDTPPEEAFDDLTMLAATSTHVPISLISLVDRERQWFKSRTGLDVEETPRSISFCGHVVASGQILVVEDAMQDERFYDNPLVTGSPNIRFYAGAPLTDPRGLCLGTLCIIDPEPRRLTEVEQQQLIALARQVVRLLEARRVLMERRHVELALVREKKRLEQSNAELEQYAAVCSHDLKEPLRMMTSFAEILAEELEGRLSDEEHQYLAFITDGGERLRAMIQGVLEVSRLETTLEMNPVDLHRVLSDAMANLGSLVAETKARIEVGEIPGGLYGSAKHLVRVFQNIIGNAIKFRRADVSPVVRIDGECLEDMLHLRIADNGIGFEPDQGRKIFEIFRRLNRREDYEGHGLGLAIVAKLVAAHGGSVWAEGDPNEGATIHLTLPASSPPEQTKPKDTKNVEEITRAAE